MPPARVSSQGVIPTTMRWDWVMVSSDFEDNGLKLPGMVVDVTEAKAGESNQQSFYQRWAGFMEARCWNDLAAWRNGTKPQL